LKKWKDSGLDMSVGKQAIAPYCLSTRIGKTNIKYTNFIKKEVNKYGKINGLA
jgi:hypothetical protein